MKILRQSAWSVVLAFAFCGNLVAQPAGHNTTDVKINESVEEVEVVVGGIKRLEFSHEIPDLIVENDQIIRVQPIARNQILITGRKPGTTAVTVRDDKGNLRHFGVVVVQDARDLQRLIQRHFPGSNVRAIPTKSGVLLKGTVSNPDDISTMTDLASDYFPKVINKTIMDSSQMVAIEVKVYEVSRTKFRNLGVDWAYASGGFNIGSSVAGIISSLSPNPGTLPGAGTGTVTFGVVSDNRQLSTFIDFLEQRDVAKLLDQPTLIAVNGRAAQFLSGGEIPIQVASGLGTNSVEFRPFGTRLDIVPVIRADGRMRLELRAEVSEVANDLSSGTGVPGFRVRRVDTGVEMTAGHTLALAGDYREETETRARGIPGLMNVPGIGSAFRQNRDTHNETELVFLITPRFVADVPAGTVNGAIGRSTTSPSNTELYHKGYIEVPKCRDDCPTFSPAQPRMNTVPPYVQPGVSPNPGPTAAGSQAGRGTSVNGQVARGRYNSPSAANAYGYPRQQSNAHRANQNRPQQMNSFGFPEGRRATNPPVYRKSTKRWW